MCHSCPRAKFFTVMNSFKNIILMERSCPLPFYPKVYLYKCQKKKRRSSCSLFGGCVSSNRVCLTKIFLLLTQRFCFLFCFLRFFTKSQGLLCTSVIKFLPGRDEKEYCLKDFSVSRLGVSIVLRTHYTIIDKYRKSGFTLFLNKIMKWT